MHVVYSDPAPNGSMPMISPAVFLAGTTPRSPDVKSWRPEAINHFDSLRFESSIIVPEPFGGVWRNPDDQVDWEQYYLERSKVILFWIPRNMATLPGLTTNIEFGIYMMSGKLVVGIPNDAENVGYIKYCCRKFGIPLFDNLGATCRLAAEQALQHYEP